MLDNIALISLSNIVLDRFLFFGKNSPFTHLFFTSIAISKPANIFLIISYSHNIVFLIIYKTTLTVLALHNTKIFMPLLVHLTSYPLIPLYYHPS